MHLDEDLCYRAMRSRDARFDGRFFTAVLTTGVYCRPTCPARQPLRRNVRYFACAAAAEEAGFRPCRRCRPEAAPGTPAWVGTPATVARALRLIERGALDRASVDFLAARLGIGARHLRRLFLKHLGAAPKAIASSRRAHFARGLLDRTTLDCAEVAIASGFHSVRRFNQAIKAVFGRTPTQMRARGERRKITEGVTVLQLGFRPPFDWRSMLAFLSARAIPGVEQVDESAYRRSVASDGGVAGLEIKLAEAGHALELKVSGGKPSQLLELVRRVRRQFDLDADPLAIASGLGSSKSLAALVSSRPGLRVPGAFDPFELLVRAILGQQISVAAATTLSGRLALRFGTPCHAGPGLTRLFPGAAVLAKVDVTQIGLPRARAKSISQVAAAVAASAQVLEPEESLEGLIDKLCRLPGVGPWTAHYVAMRGFSEPDAFPCADLGLRRALGDVSATELEAMSQSWRPWRAYAAMHLWAQDFEEARSGNRAVAS